MWKERQFATRLNSFRVHGGERIAVAAAIASVARVPGISALELNFPQHFADDPNAVLAAAAEASLPITALNSQMGRTGLRRRRFHPSRPGYPGAGDPYRRRSC